MIVLPVVPRGTTPTAMTTLGVSVPLYSGAPPSVLLTPKCVRFGPGFPVHAGNSMLFAGLTLLPVTTHPPAVRTTATRA